MLGSRRTAYVTASLLALALAAGLTGCWPTPDPVAEPTFPAEPQQLEPLTPITEPAVLAYCPAVNAVHYDGFAPYEFVYACRADDHRPSDGVTTYGPWEATYRIRDPQTLLAQYATPNGTRRAGPCPARAADPLILWVHARGTVEAIYAPVDECGFPRDEIVTAYANSDRDLLLEFDSGAPLDAHDTPAEH